MSALDSMDRAVTMECNCCGNRDSVRFVKREDGYVCKCCGQWFRYETDAEKSRCSQGYENLSNYKFDDARSIFQRVIIDNPGSVSARWGLLLARFGIVFTKAFAKADAAPVYCFPEYEEIKGRAFSGEEEYSEMIELIGNDEELIYFYKKKAHEIDGAIEKICENKVSRANDIFICVKADAATELHPELSGETEDLRFAKKIYEDLTSHGLNVFFAPTALSTDARADELIWPNLVKSKKMLLIASKQEYVDSVWVKSEWRRWNGLGREKELYTLVLKHENESPKAVLPHELLQNESQLYTLDTYDRLINEISVDDSGALDGQENGRIILKSGREERVRYGTLEIAANAFKDRQDIVSVSLPGTVISVGKSAFAGCINMESLTVREGTRFIEDNAFSGCDKLREMSLPKTLVSIGSRAFGGCGGLIAVSVPPRTERIGDGAFSGCTGLMNISIPASVKSIGMGALGLCRNLSAITVEAGGASYKAVGNCLIDLASGALIAGCKDSVIPQDGSIKAIGESAFAGCDIRSAAIPEGVTSIGDSAFSACEELTSVSIPASVSEVGGYVFCMCKNLRKIAVAEGNARYKSAGGCLINKQNKILVAGSAVADIPHGEGLETVGAQAFMGADITEITIPDGVEIIENEAFRDCRELESIKLPASLIAIGEDAFRGCTKLKTVKYAGAPSAWQKMRIDRGNEALTGAKNGASGAADSHGGAYGSSYGSSYGGYTSPRGAYDSAPNSAGAYGSYSAGSYASGSSYSGYESANSRPDFGFSAFGAGLPDYAEGKTQGKIVCFGGIEESIMYGAKEVKDGAYSGRTDIISIELPDSVKSIGKNAFQGCARLEKIVIPETVTAIGDRAFSGCAKLAEIALPEATQQLGAGAFYGCKALKEVKIPANVKSIGADTFANCTSLESVRIPDGVTEIGERAFIECTSLKNVYFSGTQAQWKAVKIGAGNPKMGGFLAKIKVTFNS